MVLRSNYRIESNIFGIARARARAEASHERLVDPPGGIPGAGGVVGKAEIPGGWLTAK